MLFNDGNASIANLRSTQGASLYSKHVHLTDTGTHIKQYKSIGHVDTFRLTQYTNMPPNIPIHS